MFQAILGGVIKGKRSFHIPSFPLSKDSNICRFRVAAFKALTIKRLVCKPFTRSGLTCMRKDQGPTQSVTETLNPQIFESHSIYQIYLLSLLKIDHGIVNK